MINIFVGLIFVFFKTNINFWDIGVAYYLTNVIGYVSIFFGVKELGRRNKSILKVKPYVVMMIVHSIIFLLLNVSNRSPLKMGISTMLDTIIVLVGIGFILAGMFMIFIIIFQLVDGLTSNTNKRLLQNLVSIMMLLFILAGISAIFNFIPMLATTIMGALLVLELLFLISYYSIFLTKNEKYT